ncbi:conserved hypothetical protein [Streptomyces sviceus ATCC 29083]|uniref:Uncharacterized protein n=1 Tax=Streptomyces sviceus (strain ATCC 29083 / DSM 924 / JCM 4929 / NBRC 13980 / NCIMB 11184 / NRRL 5439 / UC 5370) TaxID=463191 RepID=B5I3K5_STRX2|nr:conserved hypothetical protein [Streptomyces sviceus ATCC 29083]
MGGAGLVRFSDMVRSKCAGGRDGRADRPCGLGLVDPRGVSWLPCAAVGPRPAPEVARPAQATLLDTGQAGLAGHIRRGDGARLVLAVDASRPDPGSVTERVE